MRCKKNPGFFRRLTPLSLALPPILSGLSLHTEMVSAQSLEEVTVTARRRVESLQETPLSVMSLNSDALEQQNVGSLKGLDIKMPNVAAGGSGGLGGSNASFFIRGIGTDRNAVNQETAIALYVDDAYYGRTDGALLGVLDVNRIEVLRGPQGTLFGRSATGGAIRYITNKPTDEFEGSVQATFGSEDRVDLKGVVNLPLGESFAARVTAASLNQDGHVDGVFTGKDYGDIDNDMARAYLRWEASETLEVLASVDYTKIDTNGAPAINFGINPDAPFVQDEAAAGFDATRLPQGQYDKSYVLGDNYYDSDNYGANLTFNWALADSIDFKSTTSYRDIDIKGAYDADAVDAALFEQIFDRDIKMFSQELQLSGNTDNLNWMAGLFYYEEEASENRLVRTTANSTPDRSSTRIVDPYKVESYAVFGQATYDLNQQWAVTGGLRYTYDDKSIEANELKGSGEPRLPENEKNDDNWDAFSGRLSLEYQATDDIFLFGSYARGYRSGGFNDRIRTDLGPENNFGVTPFDEETIDMFELGMRSEFFDQRLRLNLTVFYGEYSDMQISSILPGTSRNVIQNIGESEISGLEGEVIFVINDIFTVDGSFGYLDAEYTDIDTADAAVTEDSDFGRAPETSYSLGLEADFGEIVGRVDYGWKDNFRSLVPDANYIEQDSYGLLSANISYAPDGGSWKLSAFGTNLTDEDYLVSGLTIWQPLGFAGVEPGRFREYGVKVEWIF